MSEINVRDVNFEFDRGERVLQGLDFACQSGEFISVLGASGCGKSTLLRLLAGLLQPTSGQIRVDGRAPRAAGKMGFVFQQPTLCPWKNTLGNIQLPLRLRGDRSGDRIRRAQQARGLVGLTAADERKLPQQLSGGMQMRVSLARALVTQPQVMLMDEPFSALDEVLRQQLCETCLEAWQQQAWTTVFVTHNVTEAAFMSQRIYVLSSRPASIVDVLEVPFATRDSQLRTSVEFLGFVSDVSQRLRHAVEGSHDEGRR